MLTVKILLLYFYAHTVKILLIEGKRDHSLVNLPIFDSQLSLKIKKLGRFVPRWRNSFLGGMVNLIYLTRDFYFDFN